MFSLSILLPAPIENALIAWSRQTPGATVDPQASHVTLLNFETGADAKTILPAFQAACAEVMPFRIVLDRAECQPYLGKPGLDIVMLVPSEGSPARAAVIDLRQGLLNALEHVIEIDTTVPEDGEFLPHLTMTAGLEAKAAEALCTEAENLHIAFEVKEVSFWSNEGDTWRLLASAPLAES